MKSTLSALLILACSQFSGLRSEPLFSMRRAFYVSGVECGACVYLVQLAASECKGVLKADVTQAAEGIAQVTFDPRLVTEHQIAHAIRGAMPLHGAPYLARLKVRVGEYPKHSHDLELLFQKWSNVVRCEVLDRNKGEFFVHFLPMEPEAVKNGLAGWSAVRFSQALQTALSPGATVEYPEEGQ